MSFVFFFNNLMSFQRFRLKFQHFHIGKKKTNLTGRVEIQDGNTEMTLNPMAKVEILVGDRN